MCFNVLKLKSVSTTVDFLLISPQDLVGKVGIAEGYGYTEGGTTSNIKRTVNVTVKDNAWCADQLRANFSRHLLNKAILKSNLYNGLNDQIICTQGELTNSAINIGEQVYGVSAMKKLNLQAVAKPSRYSFLCHIFVPGCVQGRQWRPSTHSTRARNRYHRGCRQWRSGQVCSRIPALVDQGVGVQRVDNLRHGPHL